MSRILQASEALELTKSPLWELNLFPVPPPPVFGYTSLSCFLNGYGWKSFDVTLGRPLDGNRYLQIDTSNVILKDDLSPITVTGTILLDQLNDSVISHSVTPVPPGISLLAYDQADLWPPSSHTTTEATWVFGGNTEQSITLSSPVSLDDLGAAVAARIHAVDMMSLQRNEAYETGWRSNTGLPSMPYFDYLVASWGVDDDGVTIIPVWVAVTGGQTIIRDRDILPYSAPSIYLDDIGPWSPGSPGPSSGPKSDVQFNQGNTVWSSSRMLVRGLPANSSHCVAARYDDGAKAAGNSDNAFTVGADASGNLYVEIPDLLIDSRSTKEGGSYWLYINQHPSGITCLP